MMKIECNNYLMSIEYSNEYINLNSYSQNILGRTFTNNLEKLLTIIYHIYMLITFEIMFYFYYVVKIEKKEFVNMISSFASQVNKSFNSSYYEKNKIMANFSDICNNIDSDFLEKINYELFIKSLGFLLILTIIVFIVSILYVYMQSESIYTSIIKLTKIIVKCLLYLLTVGCFEFWFFKNIVLKYHIINNNEAICDFIKFFLDN